MNKTKVSLAAFAFMLAIGGALATSQVNATNTVAPVPAYRIDSEVKCDQQIGFCDIDNPIPCELGTVDLTVNPGECVQALGEFSAL